MKVISPGPTFCASGAIVLNKKELSATIHALKVEYANVKKSGGHFYGPSWGQDISLSLGEMEELITNLEEYQKEN